MRIFFICKQKDQPPNGSLYLPSRWNALSTSFHVSCFGKIEVQTHAFSAAGPFITPGNPFCYQIWEKSLYPGNSLKCIIQFLDILCGITNILSFYYAVNLMLLQLLYMWVRFLPLLNRRNSGYLWQMVLYLSHIQKAYPIHCLLLVSAHHMRMMSHLYQ